MKVYKIGWHIILTLGIICIMSISFNSFAKTAFSKQRVSGVMSTAVGLKVVVSWAQQVSMAPSAPSR